MPTATPTSKNRRRDRGGDDNQSLRKRLLALLREPAYRPMNKSELARALEVSPKQRQALRHLLSELESSGTLRQIKKGRYTARGGGETIGILRFQPAGHAFLDPLDGGRGTGIFIPPNATGTALHGDKVAVQIQKRGGPPHWVKHIKNEKARAKLEAKFSADPRSAEGRVVKVLERRNDAVIGTFRRKGKFVYVQPDDALLPPTIELDPASLPDPAPEPGDKVVVAIDHWESRRTHPRGEISELLGPPDSAGV